MAGLPEGDRSVWVQADESVQEQEIRANTGTKRKRSERVVRRECARPGCGRAFAPAARGAGHRPTARGRADSRPTRYAGRGPRLTPARRHRQRFCARRCASYSHPKPPRGSGCICSGSWPVSWTTPRRIWRGSTGITRSCSPRCNARRTPWTPRTPADWAASCSDRPWATRWPPRGRRPRSGWAVATGQASAGPAEAAARPRGARPPGRPRPVGGRAHTRRSPAGGHHAALPDLWARW